MAALTATRRNLLRTAASAAALLPIIGPSPIGDDAAVHAACANFHATEAANRDVPSPISDEESDRQEDAWQAALAGVIATSPVTPAGRAAKARVAAIALINQLRIHIHEDWRDQASQMEIVAVDSLMEAASAV